MPSKVRKPNFFLDLAAALLPGPEREALVRRGAEPAGISFFLGLAELFGGALLLISNALATFQALADSNADYVVNKMDPRLLNSTAAKFAIVGNGPILWLTWVAHPLTWLLISISLVGLARLVAFAATREAVGEPLIWLPLRLLQGVGRLLRKSERRVRFGGQRPDRLLREGEDLVILSSRPKPDWNERVTIEVEERFYRLRKTEERQVGSGWAYAYVLAEAGSNELIRGLVRWEGAAPPSIKASKPAGPPSTSAG
jgi:hypothetical protein